MKRLFFALCPDPHARQSCNEIIAKLPAMQCKPVDAANLHVTLIFLGNVDLQQEFDLIAACDNMRSPVIELRFDYMSTWLKPKIACLRASITPAALSDLVQQLALMAESLGIAIDKRPYQTHITLAKQVKQEVNISFTPIRWHSDSYHLIQSTSLVNGVHYEIIHTWPLC